MPVVFPEEGKFAEVANQLLALAGHPRDVATTTDGPGLGLVVSDDLYRAWVDSLTAPVAPVMPKKRTTKKESTS